MNGRSYIFWDWNGTLLDDTSACVGALNVMLAKRGFETISYEYFRENFSFPARNFYRLVGMDVPDEQWDALAMEYHLEYSRQPAKLNAEAIAALEAVKSRGIGQCVISALRQDKLESDLGKYGLSQGFERIYGTDNLDGGSKLDRARELYESLGRPRAVMIGDAIHDKEVADALGVGCVLVATGGHSVRRLSSVAPTAMTLLQAVGIAVRQLI